MGWVLGRDFQPIGGFWRGLETTMAEFRLVECTVDIYLVTRAAARGGPETTRIGLH